MNKWETFKLKPEEYVSVSELETMPALGTWVPACGMIITKDNKNMPIPTAISIDPGCEIEVRYNGKIGKVKYLSSTPRRKYYVFLRWYIILIEFISICITFYERTIKNEIITKEHPANGVLVGVIAVWLCLCIPMLRNDKGVTKWIMTIFGYFILGLATIELIRYFIMLIV